MNFITLTWKGKRQKLFGEATGPKKTPVKTDFIKILWSYQIRWSILLFKKIINKHRLQNGFEELDGSRRKIYAWSLSPPMTVSSVPVGPILFVHQKVHKTLRTPFDTAPNFNPIFKYLVMLSVDVNIHTI